MDLADDSPRWLSGYRAIQVDPSGLDRFAGAIEDEVEGNFRPHTHDLFAVYELGVRFGAGHVSADVLAAREKHHQCLQGAADQLASFINASHILIQVARQIAKNYGAADAMAAARAKEIDDTLNAAILFADEAAKEAREAVAQAAAAEARDLRRRGIE
jgi:hypothetical protein